MLFFISTILFSCGDDGSQANPANCDSRKENLVSGSGTWKLSKLEIDIPNFGDNVNIFSPTILGLLGSPANITCLQDNTVTFNSGGTFVASEGTNVCDGFPESGSGSWSFSEQTGCDSIRLGSGSDSLAFLPVQSIPISSFSETEFVSQLSIDIDTIFSVDFLGSTISVGPILDATVTFEKQ